MLFVRAVHINKFSRSKKRFQSCFSNHQGGISIFDKECAVRQSGSICNHISKYYYSAVDSPIIYCIFSTEIVQEVLTKNKVKSKAIYKISGSTTGDECHYDIENLKNSEADKLTPECRINKSFFSCNPDQQLDFSDEATLKWLSDARDDFENRLN
jgi:hypothetical protein